MTHLEITLKAKGDLITAISQAMELAKASKETLYLEFHAGKLSIRPTSDVMDIIEISALMMKLKDKPVQTP